MNLDIFPGCALGPVYGLNQAEYRAIGRMSPSAIRWFDESPAAYLGARDNPKPPTPLMRVGVRGHCAGLEPEAFESRFAVAPEKPAGLDGRTSEGKEWFRQLRAWEASLASGVEVITAEERAQALAIGAAVRANAKMAEFLATGRTEGAMFWTDAFSGVDMMGRFDLVVPCAPRRAKLIDLKVVDNLDVFRQGAFKNLRAGMYHRQIALYCDGYEAVTGVPAEAWFCMAGRNPPYPVEVYQITAETQALGLRLAREKLTEWADCLASGSFPKDSGGLVDNEPLDLTHWTPTP